MDSFVMELVARQRAATEEEGGARAPGGLLSGVEVVDALKARATRTVRRMTEEEFAVLETKERRRALIVSSAERLRVAGRMPKRLVG